MLDAALLASVQKIEHYCIAAWGTAKSMGNLLEQQKAVEAMERALDEGKRYDEEMTQLAESEVNPAMLGQEEQGKIGDEQEGEDEEKEEEEDKEDRSPTNSMRFARQAHPVPSVGREFDPLC